MPDVLPKIPTGIAGFDELSHGGLPRHPAPCAPRKAKSRKARPSVATVVAMRLYIAAGAPNSVKAIANLESICKKHLAEGFKLEVIDALEFPLRALADGILVTPSLAKLSPSPAAKVVGDLSDRSSVLVALGIKL